MSDNIDKYLLRNYHDRRVEKKYPYPTANRDAII